MSKQKYSCFAFTLRPRDGIRDTDISVISKRLLPSCQYYHIITEKLEEERHIHGCVILSAPKDISYFNKRMKTFFSYLIDEDRAVWKVAYKGKPWYNEDWYVNYCNKDDNTVVIFNKMCTQDERLSLYVDVQVQDRSSRAADPYFARLEKMWDEQKYSVVYDSTPVPLGYTRYISKMCTLQEIERFLATNMYDLRTLRCVQDSRKLRRICHTLYHYITRSHALPWEMSRQGVVGSVIAVAQEQEGLVGCYPHTKPTPLK